MALEEEFVSKKKPPHEVGQDLSGLSIAEIDERVALLTMEIERLREAKRRKQATASAADALFKKS